MGKVALTGGTGFIGSHIARELHQRGYEVRILARPHSDLSLLQSVPHELVRGDVGNVADLTSLLEGCDALIHTAAYYPTFSLRKQQQINSGLAQVDAIHSALTRSGVKKFLYISAMAAVGRYPDGAPEDEMAPFPTERLSSTYHAIKFAMQKRVLDNAEQFNSVVLAPTGVFGPGDRKPTTGRLLLDIARGKMPVTLHGKLNVVDVRIVAEGVVNALERGKTGRAYLFGGVNTTLPEISRVTARLAGVAQPRFTLNPRMLRPFALALEALAVLMGMKRPPLPVIGLEFAIFGEHYSSEIARKEISYRPEGTDFEQMIQDTLDYFRQVGKLT